MSEFSDQGQAAGSAGALIRRAREDAGLHIAALAVALKVPVKRLEALEADRYDLLPDAVFARALAGSVCRSLKLDPARVLPLLPQSQVRAPTVDGKINEPFRAAESAKPGWTQISRPAWIAAAVLAVAALLVYFWPELGLPWPAASEPAVPAAASSPPGPVNPPPIPAVAPGTVIEAVPPASVPVPPASDAPATR